MIVILDNIRSAQNVGSILRTCDGLGIREVYLCGITPGIDDRKVLKTSLGAEKSLKVLETPSTFDTVKGLLDKYEVVALELSKGAVDIKEYTPRKEVALVVGNEVSGVSDDVQKICNKEVMIPMKGTKESLNVSVAFGIAAFYLTSLHS
ncbi:MAG: TrmH family RNA methyltransferase [Patescibacteria group bacterium]|nr:TrmH family RNA methyltransferase [Patescibacteria group bacterium]